MKTYRDLAPWVRAVFAAHSWRRDKQTDQAPLHKNTQGNTYLPFSYGGLADFWRFLEATGPISALLLSLKKRSRGYDLFNPKALLNHEGVSPFNH